MSLLSPVVVDLKVEVEGPKVHGHFKMIKQNALYIFSAIEIASKMYSRLTSK